MNPQSLSISDLENMSPRTIEAEDSDDVRHRFTGVFLSELLQNAGVTTGSKLQGEYLVKYVLITAADGYEVLFSLPEIDPYFTENKILLAYAMDNARLPDGYGPFRIVVPGEKRHARWIREIRSINIIFSK
ncbi:molybdopterin-binding protein [Robertkochia solimangrovi]|nr:molybdopterin-binding protein [Robertkochia solimangrovi]